MKKCTVSISAAKRIVEKSGLTQKEFAVASGVSKSNIGRLMHDSSASPKTLRMIGEYHQKTIRALSGVHGCWCDESCHHKKSFVAWVVSFFKKRRKQ